MAETVTLVGGRASGQRWTVDAGAERVQVPVPRATPPADAAALGAPHEVAEAETDLYTRRTIRFPDGRLELFAQDALSDRDVQERLVESHAALRQLVDAVRAVRDAIHPAALAALPEIVRARLDLALVAAHRSLS